MDTSDSDLSAHVLTTAELAAFDYDFAAIDVPIGLPDRGSRRADQAARVKLGWPRCASVFPTPIRPALRATSWEEACDITATVDGRRVPRQTFAILPKIREIDGLLQANAGLHHRLLEVHPELSFAAWAGTPMVHRKKSAAGRQSRQELIAQLYGPNEFSRLAAILRGNHFGSDDLADAFANLWTARRVQAGTASRLPAEPAFDSTGLPMHMWY